jgi:pimeloyl-ACP methyl ester carboxylesterase
MSDKPLIVLIHGFANPNGKHTTDLLRPHFEKYGYKVWEWDYGWKGIVGVWFTNTVNAYGLSRFTKYVLAHGERVVVVAHSNGCVVANRASLSFEKDGGKSFPGAKFSRFVFINPALPSKVEFGRVDSVIVLSTPWDIPTRVSKLVYPWWGSMGATGYRGNDPRISTLWTNTDKEHPVYDHNDVLKTDYWREQIVSLAVGGL